MRRILCIAAYKAAGLRSARIFSAARLRLLFGIFLAVSALAGCNARVDLLAATNDAEANEMLAVLLHADIPAGKTARKSGITIDVPEQNVAQALDLLHERGLPRERFDGIGGVFHKDGMISSPLEERARYIFALSQELSHTLSQMDGVVVARVHVVLPERGTPGSQAGTPASAAVFIKHRSDYNLDALRPQIRTLVTHAIPGLDDGQVSVALVPSQPDRHVAVPPTRRILGIDVARHSASALAWTLGLLILSMLGALTAALILMWRQGVSRDSGRGMRAPPQARERVSGQA